MNTPGSYSITVQACDTYPECVSTNFLVNVIANSPPVTTGLTNQVWANTAANTYTIPLFTDANGDTIVYTMNAACSGGTPITFVASPPSISAAIGATSGVYSCSITADDSYTGGQTVVPFTVTIGAGPVQTALVAQTRYVG